MLVLQVPWNAENRTQYCKWITACLLGADGKGKPNDNAWGINVVHFHVAQADPVTTTLDGADFSPIDHATTPAQVSWCCEWDSVAQAKEFWETALATQDVADGARAAGGGNPYWPKGKTMHAYQHVEQVWMTACAHV